MPRILLVEDNPAYAAAVESCLQGAGFDVEVAADTMAVLSMDDAGTYDLFLVDIAMPEGKPSGILRPHDARHPTTPVISISAYDDIEVALAQRTAKALAKSIELADLVSEVRSQLAGVTQSLGIDRRRGHGTHG